MPVYLISILSMGLKIAKGSKATIPGILKKFNLNSDGERGKPLFGWKKIQK